MRGHVEAQADAVGEVSLDLLVGACEPQRGDRRREGILRSIRVDPDRFRSGADEHVVRLGKRRSDESLPRSQLDDPGLAVDHTTPGEADLPDKAGDKL